MNLKALYAKLFSANWATWLGHAALGGLIVLVGTWWGFTPDAVIFAVFVAFFYREVSDLLAWAFAPEPKLSTAAKVADGFFDLTAPLAGAGVVGAIMALL